MRYRLPLLTVTTYLLDAEVYVKWVTTHIKAYLIDRQQGIPRLTALASLARYAYQRLVVEMGSMVSYTWRLECFYRSEVNDLRIFPGEVTTWQGSCPCCGGYFLANPIHGDWACINCMPLDSTSMPSMLASMLGHDGRTVERLQRFIGEQPSTLNPQIAKNPVTTGG